MMKFLNKYPTEIAGVLVLVALAFMVSLSGCSAVGVPAPDTFNKKVVAAYTTVSTVSETATVLLKAGKITKDEAKKVYSDDKAALAVLDQAVLISKTDPAGASTKLTSAIQTLTALQAFLAARQAP